jgi:hypothetical protein
MEKSRTVYNKYVYNASDVKDALAKITMIGDSVVALSLGEIVIVHGEEGLYGTSDPTNQKIVKFNGTDVIKMSSAYTGTSVKAGDSLDKAFSKVESEIKGLKTATGGSETNLSTVKKAIGLNQDGSHAKPSGTYTKGASTVEEEIEKLDEALKKTNDNVVDAQKKIDTLQEDVKEIDDKITNSIEKTVQSLTVSSNDNSINVATNASGTNLEVSVDNTTIVKSESGALRSALKMKKLATATSGYAATYQLGYVNTQNEWVNLGDTIDIAKSLVVSKGKVIEITKDNRSDYGDGNMADGKYIELTINGQDEKLYINLSDLVDVYTGNSGITVDENNVISIKISEDSQSYKNDDGAEESYLYINKYDNGLAVRGIKELAERVSNIETISNPDTILGQIDVKGDATTYSEVKSGYTVNEKKETVKTYTVYNKIKSMDATDLDVEHNGLVTALDVKNYVTKTVDGDEIRIGDNALNPVNPVGRVNYASSDPGYDTVHTAVAKLDNNEVRLGEALGFSIASETQDDLNNIYKYPLEEVQTKEAYISGTTDVMEAIYGLSKGIADEKQNLRDDLDEFSANTVSALERDAVKSTGNSITIKLPSTADNATEEEKKGTNIEVNIHKATTASVSKIDDEVVVADKNFLEQATTGDKGLKVTGMDSDVTVTTADIKILGWNGQVGGGVYENWKGTDKSEGDSGINTIKKGTSIQEILENLLSRVLYPNVPTKPSMSLSRVSNMPQFAKIGDEVTIPAAKMNYGSGKFNASYTNVSQPAAQYTWSNKSIKASKTSLGFADFAGVSVTGVDSSTTATATASLGTNKVEYTSSASYSAPTNKPKRNDNEETTQTGKTATNDAAIWVASSCTATTSAQVEGVYPLYTSVNNQVLMSSPSKELSLQSSATITITNVPGETDTTRFMFAFPATKYVKSFLVKDLSGNYVTFTGSYTSSDTIVKNINGTDYTYKILQTTGAKQGTASYKITLDTPLNQ